MKSNSTIKIIYACLIRIEINQDTLNSMHKMNIKRYFLYQ